MGLLSDSDKALPYLSGIESCETPARVSMRMATRESGFERLSVDVSMGNVDEMALRWCWWFASGFRSLVRKTHETH